MRTLSIIWYHVKACRTDLRASKLGTLELRIGQGNQLIVENERQEWRLR